MAGPLSFSVDMTGLTAGLQTLAAKIKPANNATAMAIGLEIMRLSQMEVPHDKGSLQNSGTVEQIGDYVVVGYHEPYAARLHEHPEYRFREGRKGKYLSDPITNNASVLGLKFADDFGKAIE